MILIDGMSSQSSPFNILKGNSFSVACFVILWYGDEFYFFYYILFALYKNPYPEFNG